jgi:hypothetical protein
MTTVATKIKRCAGLVDTKDVSERENDFLKSVMERTEKGLYPERLSIAQRRWLEDIFDQHYA